MIISITDDFDLTKIMNSGQAFRIAEVNGYYRFITGSDIIYIKHIEGPAYELSGTFNDDPSCKKALPATWHDYFDLKRDYASIRKLASRDEFLRNAADCGKGIRILKQDPFECMITFIISQRKSIPSIKSCVEAIAKKYGAPMETKFETVYRFPTPEELSIATEDELRELKTGYRAPYIIDAVRRVNSGELNLEALTDLNDEDLIEALKTVTGIGDKVANCIGLFSYGRTGLAPVDTWIKKIMDRFYNGKNPFLKYGDAAGIMQQYAFYYAVTSKLKL